MTTEDLGLEHFAVPFGGPREGTRGYRSQRQKDAAPRGTTPATGLDARRRRHGPARGARGHRAWPCSRSRTAPAWPWSSSRRSRPGTSPGSPTSAPPVTAVRRYGDLVQRRREALGVLEAHWGTALAGFAGRGRPAPGRRAEPRPRRRTSRGSVPASHLSRYPGDGTHLRAFTQTDEVPGVRRPERRAADGHTATGSFTVTGSFPAVPAGVRAARRSSPLVLRGAIWITAASPGRGARRPGRRALRPQLLADIHLVHHPSHDDTRGAGRLGRVRELARAPGAHRRSCR